MSRRQQTLNVQIPYTRSHAGLHLLVDSTGIKFLGEGEWKCKKHGSEYRRQWRKLHIGIDAHTMQIRAICVTSNNVSDAAVIPDLLVKMHESAKATSSCIATQRLLHARDWVGRYGKLGVATTGEVWWKPK